MEYSNILIAVDGSKFSQNAARSGIELAKELSASVTLLCVVDISTIVNTSDGGIINSEIFTIYAEEAREILDSITKESLYSKIKKVTEEGIPKETILNIASSSKADMIVMGTHGRRGLSHLFMGSVAEYVIRHSKIPVIVVPMQE